METLKSGKPYIMFGDGTLAACKPISESDLASFIADCVQGEDRINKVLPIGGEDPHTLCPFKHPLPLECLVACPERYSDLHRCSLPAGILTVAQGCCFAAAATCIATGAAT